MIYPEISVQWKPHNCYINFVMITISSFCDLIRLKMASGKAQIGKLAPDFTAKAVMPDGQFKELKLSDYRGILHLDSF